MAQSPVLLVPVDGSEEAKRALNHALTLAKELSGSIMILNVQPHFNTPNVKRFFSEDAVHEYQQQLGREAVEKSLEVVKEEDVPVEQKIVIGVPSDEICKVAKEINAMSVIMGSRGLGAVKAKFLGSVSYRVLHDAPCPVTIVP